MTVHVDILEAQQRFLELIQTVSRGEAVIITKDTLPIAQMMPPDITKKRPRFGSARGLMTIPDEFDLPIDDFREYMP